MQRGYNPYTLLSTLNWSSKPWNLTWYLTWVSLDESWSEVERRLMAKLWICFVSLQVTRCKKEQFSSWDDVPAQHHTCFILVWGVHRNIILMGDMRGKYRCSTTSMFVVCLWCANWEATHVCCVCLWCANWEATSCLFFVCDVQIERRHHVCCVCLWCENWESTSF